VSTTNFKAMINKSPVFARQVGGPTGFEGSIPPQYVLDRLAEEAFTGKYDVSASNICPSCFTAKSANGTCFC
jgi:hypothetical protein